MTAGEPTEGIRPLRRALPALAAVLVLAGCGASSSGGSSLPTLATTTAPATTTPVVTPTATTPVVDPSPWTALPTRDVGPNKGVYTGVVLATSSAATPAENDAAQAWLRFWTYVAKVGDTARVDRAELAAVASGNAATNIENYAKSLREKNRRTIGWASLNLTSVKTGEFATLLTGCIDNGTYDVDRSTGKRLEKGSLAWDSVAAARTVNGKLVITSSGLTLRTQPCPSGER